jgi:apolipoprotein N-acyltransferase
VRATNTGVSAFVSATGDVVARLAVGVDDVLVRDVPLTSADRTPFVRYGHGLPWALAVWGLLAWLSARLTPRAGA